MASGTKTAESAEGGSPALLLDRWPWLAPLILTVLCGVLYFWRLGAAPLKDFDEAYYAEGAREMLARRDLLTPYFNGQPFLLKPVLIYWVIAAAYRLLGPSEFATRAASAIFGLIVVLVTYLFAAHTLNRRAGLLAALALALSYMWIDISRDASIDAPLAASLVPALMLFYLASRAPAASKRRLYLASYPLLGIALLAKGPVPTGVVLAGLCAYLVTAGELRRTLREAQLLPGLLLMLAVAAPWYVYELHAQPAFFDTFFIGEHIGHIQGALARTSPIWGHFWHTVAFFAPWAAFLPAAFIHAFRSRPRTHVLRFAAWWSIAVIVLFSLAKSKLAHYLAPAFPPLSLLVGAWLDSWLARKAGARASAALAFVLLGVIGAACLGIAGYLVLTPPLLRELISRQAGGWTPGPSAVIITTGLGASCLAAALLARVRRHLVVPALVTGICVAAFAYGGWFEARHAQIEAQPRKELAQYAAAVLPASEPFGVSYAKRNSTIFYLRRPIVDLGEWEPQKLREFLSFPRPAAALTRAKLLNTVQRSGPPVHVLLRRGDYVLIANHPLVGRSLLAKK